MLDKGEYDASMWTIQMAPSGDPGYILKTVYTTGGDSNPQHGYSSSRFGKRMTVPFRTARSPGAN